MENVGSDTEVWASDGWVYLLGNLASVAEKKPMFLYD